MRSKKSIDLGPRFIIAVVFIAIIVVVATNINDDKQIDLGIDGTVFSVKDFEPEIMSDGFKTWIERVISFTAVSIHSDTVTERNFDRVEWQIVSEQAEFVVCVNVDSTSGGRPEVIATVEIPSNIYNNFVDPGRDSI